MADRYFKSGTYCDNVLDGIIVATARALKLNLTVYQKGLKGSIHILKHNTHMTGKEVHLKFKQDPHKAANNHYEAMLLLHTPAERHREDKVTIMTPPCLSTIKQPINLHNVDDVVDLTDDSETTAVHQPESVQCNTSNNELHILTHLFVNIAAEWVDNLLQDIDWLKLYKIKCLPREWVQKIQDLRYFKIHSLRRKDLIGTRKVGRCI